MRLLKNNPVRRCICSHWFIPTPATFFVVSILQLLVSFKNSFLWALWVPTANSEILPALLCTSLWSGKSQIIACQLRGVPCPCPGWSSPRAKWRLGAVSKFWAITYSIPAANTSGGDVGGTFELFVFASTHLYCLVIRTSCWKNPGVGVPAVSTIV